MSGFGFFLGNYIRQALIYRWIVLVPTVLVFALVTMYVTLQPDTYESSAILMPPIAKSADATTRAEVSAVARDMFRSAADRMLSNHMLLQIIDKVDPYPDLRRTKGEEAAAETLRGKLRIDTLRGTITVTCSHSVGDNPGETSTAIVNTLTELFVATQRDALQGQIAKHKQFLDREKTRSHGNMEKSQTALDEFKSAHKNALPEDVVTNNAQIDRLSRDVQDYKMQQRSYDSRIGMLNRELARLDLDLNDVGSRGNNLLAAAIQTAKRQNAELQVTLKELKDTYADDNPRVVRLEKRMLYLNEMNAAMMASGLADGSKKHQEYVRYLMDENRKAIEDSKKEIGELDKRIIETDKKVDETRSRIYTAAQIERRYASLMRTAKEAEDRYKSIVARHATAEQRARLDNYTTAAPIHIEQAAYVPAKPASPDRLITSLMGLVVGLGLGAGLAVARHKLDRSYHKPDDLRALLPGAVLVTVPDVRKKGTRVGIMFASVFGGLFLAGIFTATVAILGVQVGWWGEPEMVRALINLR